METKMNSFDIYPLMTVRMGFLDFRSDPNPSIKILCIIVVSYKFRLIIIL